MTDRGAKDLSASIKQKLLNYARKTGLDFNALLIRFAMERLLFRLSVSPYREQFYLKRAMLFVLWDNNAHRPTKDLDLLFIPEHDSEQLVGIFREIAMIKVTGDGIQIDPESVQAEQIREESTYGGLRIKLICKLGTIQIPLQIDVGLGDSVYPSTEISNFPSLLDFDIPRIRAYPIETVVAEKLQTMVELGMRNSRLKDYYDIYYLSQKFNFNGAELSEAVQLTFQRRKTAWPDVCPIGLSKAFATEPQKQTQWQAFIRKNRLEAPNELSEIVDRIVDLVLPIFLDPSIQNQEWNSTSNWHRKNALEREDCQYLEPNFDQTKCPVF